MRSYLVAVLAAGAVAQGSAVSIEAQQALLDRAPPGHLHFLQPVVQQTDESPLLRGSTAPLKKSRGHVVNTEKLYTYNSTTPWNTPEHIDWAGSLEVSDVLHHGKCGSCFASAAKDALETAHYRETGKSVHLSLQDMVDCSWDYAFKGEANTGCSGGAYQAVFGWAADNGVMLTEHDHYANNNSYCLEDRPTISWRPSGWVEVPDDEELIKHALVNVGPLAISMLTAFPDFDHYTAASPIVVAPLNCTAPTFDKLDHSMLLVGYGTSEFGVPFWKIKNNWGTSWGDGGYWKIYRDRDCGLRTDAAYVV